MFVMNSLNIFVDRVVQLYIKIWHQLAITVFTAFEEASDECLQSF